MTRGKKIAAIVAGSLAGLLLIIVIAGIAIVQTDKFQNFVRLKIITSVEEATGGKVDIKSFAFDWHHLRATIQDFVIHGLEPADQPPLLQAKLLQVDLKMTSPFSGFVDLAYLLVDTPQADVIVFTDGHTNIPEPKLKHSSNKTGLETIVDLAIGRFDLRNGSFQLAERKIALSASGANLRAALEYNRLNPSYAGEIDVSPLHLRSGANQPVDVDVKLPLKLEKDKATLNSAQLTTPESKVVITGSMDHLVQPRASAQINAQVALDEVRRAAGLTAALDTRRAPKIADAEIVASMDEQGNYHVDKANITYGQSSIEASGVTSNIQFRSTLALGELGRLLRLDARPEGTVKLGGNARIGPQSEYQVTANVDARNVALSAGSNRISGVALDTALAANQQRIDLTGLRLNALGGGFTGSAAIEAMDSFQLRGNLHNFDLAQLTRAFMGKPLGYDGIISGPVEANGSLKNSHALVAKANLGIAPGRRGVPVSGKLNADYNGRADNITLANSFLQLPHTRIDLSGALGRQLQVNFVSRDLADFRPLGAVPAELHNGTARVNATVTGTLSAPRIAAQVAVNNFAVDGRSFTSFTAAVAANSSGASVTNGALVNGPLRADFSGSVGLKQWKPEPYEPLRVDAVVQNADLADVLALAGQSSVQATGGFNANAHITGTVGSPTGNADLTVRNGTLAGERFDSLTARAAMTPQAIDVPSLALVAGPSRIDATANYQHPVNDLARGNLRAHVASNQVQLAQFQSLVKDRPGLGGILSLNGDAAATVAPSSTGTDIQITTLNANLSARGLQMEGKNLGDLTATAATSGNAVQYNINSDFAGSTIRVNGSSLLAGKHDTNATASIANLPIDRVLAIAGRADLPLKGTLSAQGQVAGTLDDPRANATLDLTKGEVGQQPIDRLRATVQYTSQLIDVSNARVDVGPSYVELTASLQHPPGDLENGQARFQIRSNDIQLARIQAVQSAEPGLAGTAHIDATGAATLRKGDAPLFSTLDANIAAKSLSINRTNLGDLTATAQTRGGAVDFNLNSNLAGSDIRGSGRMTLAGDYPIDAKLTFANLTYSGLSPLLGGAQQPFEASAAGQVTVAGPVTRTDALRGTLEISKLEAHSRPATAGRHSRVTVDLHNDGPIVAALDKSVLTIQRARLAGSSAQLSLSGTAAIGGTNALNIRADGNLKLDMVEAFNPDIFSSGAVTLNAAVTGTTSQPSINGQLQLQNASFNLIDVSNGLSNANGTIRFNGNEAIIQSLTGETGGGKVTVTGYVGYGGPEMQFRIQANANGVHLETPETVTTQVSAQLSIVGTTSRSLASGNVSIEDVSLHSHSDVGSILSSAATPPPVATASTGVLAGMRFDIHVRTAPDVQFHTSLTENLQVDANLTLRGSPDHPGMLGRAVVTAGQIVFFGSKYTIDQGSVAFYDPNRINPVLNVSLETTVQGIDVSISVQGPLDRLKMSYRSDPPMQFSDLVSLLATGKVSTTDPVLAARQPVAPSQSFQQVGASAVLSQAVANPVSGRLERLFGVSRLKIDPQITGSSNTPQATMTLQQQISRDVTFTYTQNVSQSNPQIIRVEWAINPRFSAIAQRDINGSVDLDFFYKKRFK